MYGYRSGYSGGYRGINLFKKVFQKQLHWQVCGGLVSLHIVGVDSNCLAHIV